MISKKQVRSILHEIAEQYPLELRAAEHRDVCRISYNIQLAFGSLPPKDMSICDVGGGVGLFSVGCKAVGCHRSVLVDDFHDNVNSRFGEDALQPHLNAGVEVISRDVVADGLGAEGPFDVVTSFDSMEHWHRSPKRLFAEIIRELRPGGRFVLGVPNCVNLRKRLTVPFGYGKWSSFADWYEAPVFRGHVREPDLSDLRSIASDMNLQNIRIVGKNWLGQVSPHPLVRAAAAIMDAPLQLFPSFCSDIYLIGEKPLA